MAEAKKTAPAKVAPSKEGREATPAEIEANEQPNPALAVDADEAAIIASVPGASDIHRAEAHLAVTDSDESGPMDTTPPAYVYLDDDAERGHVSLADVASLQGIQVAPDASTVRVVSEANAPYISEGMRNDLEMHGYAIDPNTGKKVVRK